MQLSSHFSAISLHMDPWWFLSIKQSWAAASSAIKNWQLFVLLVCQVYHLWQHCLCSHHTLNRIHISLFSEYSLFMHLFLWKSKDKFCLYELSVYTEINLDFELKKKRLWKMKHDDKDWQWLTGKEVMVSMNSYFLLFCGFLLSISHCFVDILESFPGNISMVQSSGNTQPSKRKNKHPLLNSGPFECLSCCATGSHFTSHWIKSCFTQVGSC